MSEMKFYKFNNLNSLVNLSNSILKRFNVKPDHETIKQVDDVLRFSNKVVLLLFDGMGKSQIDKHLNNDNSFLSHMPKIEIDSVFPPTTVAATNALLAAKFPIETGWLGWCSYFKEEDKILDMFSGKETYGQEQFSCLPNFKVGYQNIVDRIKEANPDIYCDSFWPSFAPHNGCSSLESYMSSINNALAQNKECFIYGYWDDPDHLTHDNGVDSILVKDCINKIDKSLEKLCSQNKDTLFIVIADHSLVDVKYIVLDQYPEFINLLKRPFSLEPRCSSFFIKEGKDLEFIETFNRLFGEHFMLLSKQEALKQKIFGKGTMHPFVEETLGDYIAISLDEYTLLYHYNEDDPLMCAHHAGGTKEETQLYLYMIKFSR
ncbi:MAG: alkaline phosphatase family protein [Bacilli bacterium]